MQRGAIHIKVLPELRARIDACAEQTGISVAEFTRFALVHECERVEKLLGQRTRTRTAHGFSPEGRER